MAINKTLLRKVRNHILAEPRRYNQRTFGKKVGKNVAPCGTQACIAGWTCILSGEPVDRVASCGNDSYSKDGELNVFDRAEELLGLSWSEALTVFGVNSWPDRFQKPFNRARTKEDRARVAADYLNYIIATGKVTE